MRSLQSWIIERLLKRFSNKKYFTNEKLYAKFLKEKQEENEQPYQLPQWLHRKYDITKSHYEDIECFVFNKDLNHTKKTILYLHGGGYIKQPSYFHWRFLGKIAKATQARIYVPLYPKAPNHQFQASFDRVLLLYEDILKVTEEKDLILMGDSAGGGFALALAQLAAKKQLSQAQKIILLSPWLDVTMENPKVYDYEKKDPMLGVFGLIEMGKAYAGDTDTHHYLLSPINGKLDDLNEMHLFMGTHDVLLPDARKFNNLAQQKGMHINYYEYPKMNHIFALFPIPEGKKARQEIIQIINA